MRTMITTTTTRQTTATTNNREKEKKKKKKTTQEGRHLRNNLKEEEDSSSLGAKYVGFGELSSPISWQSPSFCVSKVQQKILKICLPKRTTGVGVLQQWIFHWQWLQEEGASRNLQFLAADQLLVCWALLMGGFPLFLFYFYLILFNQFIFQVKSKLGHLTEKLLVVFLFQLF